MKNAGIGIDGHFESRCLPTIRDGHRIVEAARQSGADISVDDGSAAAILGKARRWEKAFRGASGTQPAIPPILVLAMVGVNVVFLSVNGLLMLAVPEAWHDSVPGITQTGMFDQHFIRDSGLIQLFFGLAFYVGMRHPARRIELWTAATLWLTAHAGLHLWEAAVGIYASSAILWELSTVSLPTVFGAVLTAWAIKNASSQRQRAIAAWRGHASSALLR